MVVDILPLRLDVTNQIQYIFFFGSFSYIDSLCDFFFHLGLSDKNYQHLIKIQKKNSNLFMNKIDLIKKEKWIYKKLP